MLAFSGHCATIQGSGDRERGHDRGTEVNDGEAHTGRPIFGIPGYRHHARHRLYATVIGRRGKAGPVRP
jgi:hypothetical protein